MNAVVRSFLVIVCRIVLASGVALAMPCSDGHADEAAVMRNLKYYCGNLNGPGSEAHDVALLRCNSVNEDPDILRTVLNEELPEICRSIQEQCAVATSTERKARLSNFLTTLSCAERGFTCLSGATSRGNICDRGNINLVVRGIDEIERVGAVVPKTLRRAVRVYVEACALNRATQQALANVNTEMRAFYRNKYIGCIEAGYETTTNECTAKTDRTWQFNAVRAMFNWEDANSIITQVTIDAVRRWTGLD